MADILPPPDAGAERRLSATALLAAAVVAAILQLGQEVFLPLAIAVLTTFALSPVVGFLRRNGFPRILAVVAAVTLAFLLIGVFVLVVSVQLTELAAQLPDFQANILRKLDELAQTASEGAITSRLGEMLAAINAQLDQVVADGTASPIVVEVVEGSSPLQSLLATLTPVVAPVATAGLVIVVVIFMLIEQDELRDRFIRILGTGDIHAVTQLLEEAARRVGNYLLTQLLVNVIYAVPIGLGLWLIGVPNAMLWGLLTLVLRFVPYIGSVIAAGFPMLVAFAVSPDWWMLVWTATLFGAVELVTSNVIEPWLYGARAGVTPLAIIIAAIFWTWIWGPLGLILSTPLTVVLVVLGRHLPQFQIFDVLFGDQPVLAPEARLYQRLLVGDVLECRMRAEEALEETFVADWHRDVGIPALRLAQADLDRGVLSAAQEARLLASAQSLLDDIAPIAAEEAGDLAEAAEEGTQAPGTGRRLAVIGGRGGFDDLAAQMFGQAVAAEGAAVEVLSHANLSPSRFDAIRAVKADCIVLHILSALPSRGSLLQVRRIKRALPDTRVGVVLWAAEGASPVTPDVVREIGADFCLRDMDEALAESLRDLPATPLTLQPARRQGGRRSALAS